MPAAKSHVFISWSGIRSKRVATALRVWLVDVLHHVETFVSEEDVGKGTRGLEVIRAELERASSGVICLTPENVNAPWILYEAGALSNSLGGGELVCPLLIGLRKADVTGPLSQFQLTAPEREDVLRLVTTLNSSFDLEQQASDSDLLRRFDRMWPELSETLVKEAARPVPDNAPAKRNSESISQEILEIVRELSRQIPSLSHQAPNYPFAIGEQVSHPSFGTGKVLAYEGNGDRASVEVFFKNVGQKKLKLAYAKLGPAKIARPKQRRKPSGMDRLDSFGDVFDDPF